MPFFGDIKDAMFGGGDDEVDESSMTFLHGSLKVHVIAAEDLPDTDTCFFNIDGKDYTDAYVTGDLGNARIFKTKYILNELNPTWDEHFNIYVCHNANSLKLKVKDKEHVGATFIASTSIRAQDLASGQAIEGWFDLINGDSNHGRLNISVQYIAKENLAEDTKEVVDTYFPMREGCRMILYQDADTPQLPQFDAVTFPDGSPYETTRAWKDLFHAIQGAQKFIYITGWSVFTEIQLVRGDDDPDGFSHVGELLKAKSEEGVKVLLMVWNEKLSTDSSPGLMGTHDEETRKFFDGTGVECVLVSRAKTDGILADSFVGTCYTHHQKTVICDAPYEEDDSLRRVIAFIGGLDITDGRYDTPSFPLYSTINTLHRGDFYSNCIVGATAEVGPRQPWHDCHAKVEGPVALDIKKNFEERWCRQSEDMITRLYHVDESEFCLDAPAVIPGPEGGHWNIQLFRSITSDSCVLDLERHTKLHSKGGRLVENSIMRCMVQQIRNAKNFIYMENQYFLGSAYSWYGDSETLTHHIVPREMTQKVIEKIAAGEPFKCYVIVPMFPEGDPASAAIQEILFWQFRTMETMYRRIAIAIQEYGTGTHPTDYLSFFCLAKRECPDEVPYDELADPEPDTQPEAIRNSLRHPIYVHSKMTIVDDEYVLVGSANINQRSLGGNRDTEIAVGGFQPGHTVDEEGDPRGDVHTYRAALWAAHFGGFDEDFRNPGSDECLGKVRQISGAFWELYTADSPEHSDVHALPYPIKVEEDGQVTVLDEPFNCFPDTTAPIMGCKSGYLPEKLTT